MNPLFIQKYETDKYLADFGLPTEADSINTRKRGWLPDSIASVGYAPG